MAFKIEKNEIYVRYKGQLDTIISLVDFTDECIDHLDKKRLTSNEMSLFQKILGYVFCRSSLTLKSIILLANIGHVYDAEILLRSLLELVINLRYIDADPENRSRMYWYFGCLRNKQLADRVLSDKASSKRLHDGFMKIYPEILKQYENCLGYFPKNQEGAIPGKYFRSWSGKSIAKMAKAVKMEEYYNRPYYMQSIKIHGSIESFHEFFDSKTSSYSSGPTIEGVDGCLFEGGAYMLSIMEILNRAFKMMIDKEIEAYKEKFLSIRPREII